MKNLFLSLAILLSVKANSQWDPSRHDSILDIHGNKHSIEDVSVPTGAAGDHKGTNPGGTKGYGASTINASGMVCGYFELFFETNCGMDGSSPTDIARRNVVCQVYTDLSNWINSPLTSNPDPQTNKVRILVKKLTNLTTSTVGIAGMATALLPQLPNGNFNSAYTWDNAMWMTINTGYDHTYHNAYPMHTLKLYHGLIGFNFDPSLPFTYNLNLGAPPAAGVMDFYTLVLHEATHALGFMSMFNSSGGSNTTTSYFGRYDNFLHSGITGNPLLTQLAGCGPKFIQSSIGSLNALQPGLPNCPGSPYSPNCSNGVKYNSTSNVNVPVHTPPCWNASSLSHFEDDCSPWNNNDKHFVMSNVVPTGFMKRFLKMEERNVLCDLGYQTNPTFGSSGTLNFFNYGSGCSTNYVAGINDGVINSGEYTIITTANASTGLIFPLSNDRNAVSFSCLQNVFGAGTISNSSGTSFSYIPNMTGIHMLQYLPINAAGKRGNMTYIFIFVKDNCPAQCTISSNGGFENSVNCGSWYDNMMAVPTSGWEPYRFNINCWTPNNGTPDFYVRNCSNSFFGSGYGIPLGTINTHDFPNPGNNKFLNLVPSEGIQNQLSSPLIPGNQYQVSYKVFKNGTLSTNSELGIVGCDMPSGVVGNMTMSNLPSFYTLISNNVIGTNMTWLSYSLIFTYNGPANANYVTVFNSGPSGTNALLIDDFTIVKMGVNGAASFTPPSPLCVGQQVPNLHNFISPLNANTQAGTFTGPGVQNSGGIWSLNLIGVPTGPQNYTFSYYNPSNGCTYVTNVTINILPGVTANITASPAFVCANMPNVLTAGGGGTGATYQWLPPNASTNPLTLSPGSIGTYVVQVTAANGCTNTANITLSNGQVVQPTVNNPILCINAVGNSTIVTAGSAFTGGPITYAWSGPNICSSSGNQATVCPPLINGATYNYQVTATSPAGCPGTATGIVTITDNCCSQPTTGVIPIPSTTAGVMPMASYLINQNVTVSGGITHFQNADVWITPGKKITVPSGQILIIEHSHLYACGIKMWQGIEVQDGGMVISGNANNLNSMIEDADIALDVDNITSSHATPPLDLYGMVFNRNRIGIRLANSTPNVNNLVVNLFSCVFASRDMFFNSSTWPASDVSITGLRYASPGTPTTGLLSPYPLLSYNNLPLKSGQAADAGIKIENIGDPNGISVAPVQIGISFAPTASQFNLFDGLMTGIDVREAGLETNNNVFQNCLTGIDHNISGPMNTKLDLRPSGWGSQATDFGNRFWYCSAGVKASNVYEVDIDYGIFRSNRNINSSQFFGPGIIAVKLASNRFRYDLKYNEFNNFHHAISMEVRNGPYNFGTPMGGTFADKVTINENYFGAEVSSSPLQVNQYIGRSITMDGTLGSNWQMAGNCDILSNKFDRVFNGIDIQRMENYPTTIGGNLFQLEDDFVVFPGNPQYGINVAYSTGNLLIDQNMLTGRGTSNNLLTLIRSQDNTSMNGRPSPIVTCNDLYEASVGFEFSGPQINTSWLRNNMYQSMNIGLSLVNNGIIGVQGSLLVSSGNMWSNNGYTMPPNLWSAPNFQTYVDNSSAAPPSYIYGTTPPTFLPTVNGGNVPFLMGQSLDIATQLTECSHPNTYNPVPSQRSGSFAKINERTNSWQVQVYPNPTEGVIKIVSSVQNEILGVRILDVTGKVVLAENVGGDDETIDLSHLDAAVYFIEISNSENRIVRKKLIRTN